MRVTFPSTAAARGKRSVFRAGIDGPDGSGYRARGVNARGLRPSLEVVDPDPQERGGRRDESNECDLPGAGEEEHLDLVLEPESLRSRVLLARPPPVESRMGIYLLQGFDGSCAVLQEMVTGVECRATVPSGHRGKCGELWLFRVLPPPIPESSPHVVFTSARCPRTRAGRVARVLLEDPPEARPGRRAAGLRGPDEIRTGEELLERVLPSSAPSARTRSSGTAGPPSCSMRRSARTLVPT